MPPKFEFCRHIVGAFLLLAAALAPLPASATLPAAAWTTPGGHPLQTVQYRECSRRSQVFASQDTAWQRWREARAQGYAVSNGVVPCSDQYNTRGYCFFVFYRC
jgi:hypothetical protein